MVILDVTLLKISMARISYVWVGRKIPDMAQLTLAYSEEWSCFFSATLIFFCLSKLIQIEPNRLCHWMGNSPFQRNEMASSKIKVYRSMPLEYKGLQYNRVIMIYIGWSSPSSFLYLHKMRKHYVVWLSVYSGIDKNVTLSAYPDIWLLFYTRSCPSNFHRQQTIK